jgi:DNA mismatch repair protein MutL
MSDIIKLLPDSVANQIAAGEVIQRPASVVKELLENSIDAGALKISVIVKNAGKSLIQIIDNGCGMSETDARMCFERHATSKINNADDLFSIKTLGFRGEALASIGSVAQVELKTKRDCDELGSVLNIEGSKCTGQEPVSMNAGTIISVKNLFFNVPARRKFLKSNNAEFRHIVEEFIRVALVKPSIEMELVHNGKPVYHLHSSKLKQRIVNVFGNSYNEKIIPLEQATDYVNIKGFIGKPQYARKTRGEQYFFANNRFIKHPYLHHAVDKAFNELLPDDSYPSYFIYIDVAPETIDVNIHPTKTEINFQDNQMIYAFLQSAIKRSLARHNITPSLDFEQEQSFETEYRDDKPVINPFYQKETSYNPFQENSKNPLEGIPRKSELSNIYERLRMDDRFPPAESTDNNSVEIEASSGSGKFLQVQNKFVITFIKSGVLVIDQHNAHLRILYEKYLKHLEKRRTVTQKELFPVQITLNPEDTEILKEISNELDLIGFSIKEFGKNTFVVDGTPADCHNANIEELIENILENFKSMNKELVTDRKIALARSLASNLALKHGKKLQELEMESLCEKLFSCSVPEKTPDGRLTMYTMPYYDLEKKFN